jgi:hypothetical protein
MNFKNFKNPNPKGFGNLLGFSWFNKKSPKTILNFKTLFIFANSLKKVKYFDQK